MCGIVGFLDKTGAGQSSVGNVILKMLAALACRGPDSAGVALYGHCDDGAFIVRAKLGKRGDLAQRRDQIAERVRTLTNLREVSANEEYVRLTLDNGCDLVRLVSMIESVNDQVEVVSVGRRLEIIKQVGSPQNLEETYSVSSLVGTHGLGHTRLSTESRVDLSHSQPFWAHGVPDLAVVHNGHICNYHKLRRQYEQRGVRFYTENDSEIIGVYLGEQLSRGLSLEAAMQHSLHDFDGSFSYLVATAEALGFCKDPFAFKPLLFTETDGFVAIATEEIAIRSAFAGDYDVREAQVKEVRVWRR